MQALVPAWDGGFALCGIGFNRLGYAESPKYARVTMDQATLLALAGAFAGIWLVAGGWALLRGIGRQREASMAQRRALRLAAMIESSPALPLLVRADGRIEGSLGIARLFGLDALPTSIDALAGADAALGVLLSAVVEAQRAAKSFHLSLTTQNGARAVEVRGAPAPAALKLPGGALLWFADNSAHAAENQRLRHQRADAIAAFEAISALIEAAPFPMWFREPSLSLALVNHAYVAAVEADNAADVIARQTELVEPIAGVSARDAARAAHEANAESQRFIPVTIGGQRRMMRVVDMPIDDVGVAGYALDQQALEDARAELRRFTDARRSMLDQMSAAVAEFAPDRTLRFVNRPFLSLFLLDAEWAADAPPMERVLDRLRDNGRTPEVRDFPGWRAERRGWFALSQLHEESWLLRDGTHLRAVAQPTPDGGLLLIFEDRTEQVRLASARDTLLRVRTATFDNLFEAVAVFAPDGRLHLWNQRFRKLWQVGEEYLAAHPRLDQLLEKLAPQLADPRQQHVLRQLIVGATGDRQQRSGRVLMADDRQFDFAAIPLPDGNALFTLIDVTDSRRIERALRDRARALEEADQVKADFLSRISYDLRTPLTSIGGFAEMLAGGLAGDIGEQAQAYVRAIMEASSTLTQQIDAILDLSQSEAGAMPIERRTLSLGALIREASDAARAQCTAAGITLDLALQPSLGQVSGDAKRLRQALDLMLAHAMQGFGDSKGPKRITVHGDGDSANAQIILSDNGLGADVQGKDAVGLALVRQLVEAHHGRFERAQRAGEGTMLAIFLPR